MKILSRTLKSFYKITLLILLIFNWYEPAFAIKNCHDYTIWRLTGFSGKEEHLANDLRGILRANGYLPFRYMDELYMGFLNRLDSIDPGDVVIIGDMHSGYATDPNKIDHYAEHFDKTSSKPKHIPIKEFILEVPANPLVYHGWSISQIRSYRRSYNPRTKEKILPGTKASQPWKDEPLELWRKVLKLTLEPSPQVIQLGEDAAFEVFATFPHGRRKIMDYRVQIRKVGKHTIQYDYEKRKSEKATVTVVEKKILSLKLVPDVQKIKIEETGKYTLWGEYKDNSGNIKKWEIEKVRQPGNKFGFGEHFFKTKSYQGKSASGKLIVETPKEVFLDPPYKEVLIGQSANFNVMAKYEDGNVKVASKKSPRCSNFDSQFEVSYDYKGIRAMRPGLVRVKKPDKLLLSPSPQKIEPGHSATFNLSVTYKDGTVQRLGPVKTRIYKVPDVHKFVVSFGGIQSDPARIIVGDRIEDVWLVPKKLTIEEGEIITFDLYARYKDGDPEGELLKSGVKKFEGETPGTYVISLYYGKWKPTATVTVEDRTDQNDFKAGVGGIVTEKDDDKPTKQIPIVECPSDSELVWDKHNNRWKCECLSGSVLNRDQTACISCYDYKGRFYTALDIEKIDLARQLLQEASKCLFYERAIVALKEKLAAIRKSDRIKALEIECSDIEKAMTQALNNNHIDRAEALFNQAQGKRCKVSANIVRALRNAVVDKRKRESQSQHEMYCNLIWRDFQAVRFAKDLSSARMLLSELRDCPSYQQAKSIVRELEKEEKIVRIKERCDQIKGELSSAEWDKNLNRFRALLSQASNCPFYQRATQTLREMEKRAEREQRCRQIAQALNPAYRSRDISGFRNLVSQAKNCKFYGKAVALLKKLEHEVRCGNLASALEEAFRQRNVSRYRVLLNQATGCNFYAKAEFKLRELEKITRPCSRETRCQEYVKGRGWRSRDSKGTLYGCRPYPCGNPPSRYTSLFKCYDECEKRWRCCSY